MLNFILALWQRASESFYKAELVDVIAITKRLQYTTCMDITKLTSRLTGCEMLLFSLPRSLQTRIIAVSARAIIFH